MLLQMNQRTANVHSSKSARVFVLSATGRLVLSLVMANSCMPSSSATLACVRLFTSELRRSCGQTNTASSLRVGTREDGNELHTDKHSWKCTRSAKKTIKINPAWNNSSKTGMVMQSKCFREIAHVALLNITLCLGA